MGKIDTIRGIKISNHFKNMEHDPSEDAFLEKNNEEKGEETEKWDDAEEDNLDFINEYKLEDDDSKDEY